MKKTMIIALVSIIFGLGAQAANIPDSTHVVSSDVKVYVGDSLFVLPREMGVMKEHHNKVSKWSKIVGKVAGVASMAGVAGTMLGTSAGSLSGIQTATTVISSAGVIETAADAADKFAGMHGLDIVLTPAHSPFVIKAKGKDVNVLITLSPDRTPEEEVRVIAFDVEKNERHIQWWNMSYPLLSSKKGKKAGYKVFTWKQTGENTYIVTIPADVTEPGEYAIVMRDAGIAASIPVPTFRIE